MKRENYYDKIARGYEELYREEQLKKINLIKKYLKLKKHDKLLDVGCGTGLTTKPWQCIRYGLDPSKELLKRAKNKDKINYVLGRAENIPFPDNFFDIVISITALQNFSDIKKALSEIKRVGKNKFVLSFLKKSKKRKKIEQEIKNLFKIKKVIEEEKDIIYFLE